MIVVWLIIKDNFMYSYMFYHTENTATTVKHSSGSIMLAVINKEGKSEEKTDGENH